MRLPILKLSTVVVLILVFTPRFGDFVYGSGSEAYATLLYGDEFPLGVRVLGKSIRDTGSTKDMVVLVSDGVSEYPKALLKVRIDGSRRYSFSFIHGICFRASRNQSFPKRARRSGSTTK